MNTTELNLYKYRTAAYASGVIYLCVAFSTILDNYKSTSETTKMNSLTIKNIEILTGVHELKINDLNVKYEKQIETFDAIKKYFSEKRKAEKKMIADTLK